jgi:predicted  nucleic acid-binding Zn-ribbon protein
LKEKLKSEISTLENAAGAYKSSIEDLQAQNAAIKQNLQSEKQVYSSQMLGYD